MNAAQKTVARALADAREEALRERPSACAALNSAIDLLVVKWGKKPGFDADAFRKAANYRGWNGG